MAPWFADARELESNHKERFMKMVAFRRQRVNQNVVAELFPASVWHCESCCQENFERCAIAYDQNKKPQIVLESGEDTVTCRCCKQTFPFAFLVP